jgi:hypothetical protein
LKSFLGKCNLHYWKAYIKLKYRSLNGYIQFTGQFVVIPAQSWENSAKFAQNTNLWHFKYRQKQDNHLMIYILVFSKLSNNVGYICLKMISTFCPQWFSIGRSKKNSIFTMFHRRDFFYF